jgi:hypothetical protein
MTTSPNPLLDVMLQSESLEKYQVQDEDCLDEGSVRFLSGSYIPSKRLRALHVEFNVRRQVSIWPSPVPISDISKVDIHGWHKLDECRRLIPTVAMVEGEPCNEEDVYIRPSSKKATS